MCRATAADLLLCGARIGRSPGTNEGSSNEPATFCGNSGYGTRWLRISRPYYPSATAGVSERSSLTHNKLHNKLRTRLLANRTLL